MIPTRHHARPTLPRRRTLRPGAFTIIELLIVIAIIALLVGLLAPALASVRESTRSTVCLSNLRQIGLVFRAYADEHRGLSPALGRPYSAMPNWAIAVQAASGLGGNGAELFTESSALICPTIRAAYGRSMSRTYAINVTGHARSAFPTDPDDYDALPPAPTVHIRLDQIPRPASAALVVDSAVAPINGVAPPDTRTSSVIDFRQPIHVRDRLGRFHGGGGSRNNPKSFNVLLADGSARPANPTTSPATADSAVPPAVEPDWLLPLP